ncbi:MAG: hypothetical protein K2X27_02060 [Candidatus Obscuribacterales bacterium]|nr:hypothetical protein [Candidatus Obscuribacterales bacterium]
MSAEFEDFKPATKGVENNAKEDAAETHDPFVNDRLSKPETPKLAESKSSEADNKIGDKTVADLRKAISGFDEAKHGSDYGKYCLENCTPEQNQKIVSDLIKSMQDKMAKLSGPHSDATITNETKQGIENLMAAFKKASN